MVVRDAAEAAGPIVAAAAGIPVACHSFGALLLARRVAAASGVVEPLWREHGLGPAGDSAALGDQPASVRVTRYVAQQRLLPHCAAVVSHAGSGTFLAALSAGLPQLCLPQAADQFLNAAACARSATGLVVDPGQVRVDLVRGSVRRLLEDGSFREAAGRLGDEIAAMPSPAEVADHLHGAYA